MSSWGPVTYTIGSSSVSQFPMAQFVGMLALLIFKFLPFWSWGWTADVNNPTTIKSTLTSSQIGARTLRIRTTSAFAGGRPQVTVNSWTSSIPAGNPNNPCHLFRRRWSRLSIQFSPHCGWLSWSHPRWVLKIWLNTVSSNHHDMIRNLEGDQPVIRGSYLYNRLYD